MSVPRAGLIDLAIPYGVREYESLIDRRDHVDEFVDVDFPFRCFLEDILKKLRESIERRSARQGMSKISIYVPLT